MEVTFWGTRGSIATPGQRTIRYGGNTSCVEVGTNNGTTLILDSGTGIRELGQKLLAGGREVQAHVFLSHTHWDHIQGWPFFTPAFLPKNRFTIHAVAGYHGDLESVLANQMERHYFPVTFESLPAKIAVDEIRGAEVPMDGIRVRVQYLNHTCVCLGYRIEADGKVLVFTTDTEPHGLASNVNGVASAAPVGRPTLEHDRDREIAAFAEGADLLVMDAQYTDAEYPKKVGWGHSTAGFTTDTAVLARVKRLVLFHHDPLHGDEVIDQIVREATARARAYGSDVQVIGAAEGMTIQL